MPFGVSPFVGNWRPLTSRLNPLCHVGWDRFILSMADSKWSPWAILVLVNLLQSNLLEVRVQGSRLSPIEDIELAVNYVLPESSQHLVLTNRTELGSLFSLRSSLGLRSRDWPRKLDPCTRWRGIQCIAGHVVGLDLSGLKRTSTKALDPQFAVDGLQHLPFLHTINASGFALPGFIPEWFGQLSTLQVMDLTSSSIIGPVPASLGNLTNLSILKLSMNKLTGNIPLTLGKLSSLKVLDMSFNALTGTIPSMFSNMANLIVLDLSWNNFQGPIPSQLGNLSMLIALDLGSNVLSGSIPIKLGNLRDLNKLVLANNLLSGAIPKEISNCTKLRVLDLYHNNLSGTLPQSFGLLTSLFLLNLSYNKLTGSFPSTISLLVKSRRIGLSHNLFYGPLMPGLANLHHLTDLDLSDNFFEEKVPHGFFEGAIVDGNCLEAAANQRKQKDCTSFYDARGQTVFGFEPTSSSPSQFSLRQENKHLRPILGGVFGGLGLVFLVMVFVLFVLKRERMVDHKEDIDTSAHKECPSSISVNFLCLGEAFSYEQLRQATIQFSASNLIKQGHSGDLYQGLLEGTIPIVVKRIDLSRFGRDAYLAELDVFGKTSHTRLVPILGHCLDCEGEKLLVYKYMPNRDLSYALHRMPSTAEETLQSLDWITRLKIAIGAAEGLTYLHQDCKPSLVHGDIQASSILLDDKFEVRLGSLCKVCPQKDVQQSFIGRLFQIARTSKQDVPVATCAYDVYCFGKVLLELVSGRMGISGSSDPSADAWLEWALRLINVHKKELVTKIIDPLLIVDEDLLEEVWATSIVAKSCLNPKPSKRPLMRYILKALENPLKVVREDNSNASVRRTSSYGSWNAAVFGNWRHSSTESIPGSLREAYTQRGSSKESDIAGSQGSMQSNMSPYRTLGFNEKSPQPMEGAVRAFSTDIEKTQVPETMFFY